MEIFTVLSADQRTSLHGVCWQPTQHPPVGVVQIIHGMAEYIERYQEFAEYLTRLGYVVIGHDHLGHGASVSQHAPQYGYFAAENSAQVLLKDIDQIKQWGKTHFPALPYFMFGHSMGSFALRTYLQTHSADVTGAILTGTGDKPLILDMLFPFVQLFNQMMPQKTNAWVNAVMFQQFRKKFPENSKYNWVSKNPENISAHETDPKMNFVFTNNGFYTLAQLIKQANHKNGLVALRKDFPILLVSGEEDPVGNYGKGTKKVQESLLAAGFKKVDLFLFPALRHEILFETEKQEIFCIISEWLAFYTRAQTAIAMSVQTSQKT